jgi:uncharacterized protein YdcH (DUF465 family)
MHDPFAIAPRAPARVAAASRVAGRGARSDAATPGSGLPLSRPFQQTPRALAPGRRVFARRPAPAVQKRRSPWATGGVSRQPSGCRSPAMPARNGRAWLKPSQEVSMFEGQPQAEIEALMKANSEFRQLYYRHRELDRQVLDAELGVLPIDDTTLGQMKREKLAAKQRLLQMYERTH